MPGSSPPSQPYPVSTFVSPHSLHSLRAHPFSYNPSLSALAADVNIFHKDYYNDYISYYRLIIVIAPSHPITTTPRSRDETYHHKASPR
jgi:hypothetical protein